MTGRIPKPGGANPQDSAWAEDAEDGSFAALMRAVATTPPVAAALNPGTKVAQRYEVHKRLGSGAMGVVYLAEDLELQRKVALKLQHFDPASPIADAVLQEATAMARLQHPNVVAVYEVGRIDDDQLYIAMEYVDGESVGQWLRDAPRTAPEIVECFRQAGAGLAAAHAAGLVHRDVKPANLLRGRDGWVRVADFGLAGDQNDAAAGFCFAGTPAYAAPEQCRGEIVDARSDQFSFCASLYESIYECAPFEADSLEERSRATYNKLRRPSHAVKGTPDGLWKIISQGLSTDPDGRYTEMDALLADLEQLLNAPLRRRAGTMVGAALALAGLAGMAVAGNSSPCESTPTLSNIWTPNLSARISTAIATHGSASDSSRVQILLTEYADQWKDAQLASCTATWVDKTQSPKLLDRRSTCLQNRKRAFVALVQLLQDAKSETAALALRSTIDLPEIGVCARPRYLEAQALPPASKALDLKVRKVRDGLARINAQLKAGQFEGALADATRVGTEAETTGYPPVQAEALFALGSAHQWLGSYEASQAAMEKAYFQARQGGDDILGIQIVSAMIYLLSFHLAQNDEALRWARHAQADVQRLGDSGRLRGQVLMNVATALEQKGLYEEAIQVAREAVEELEQTRGPKHPDVATALTRLGSALAAKGDREEAVLVLERAVSMTELTLGEDHRELHRPLAELGLVLSARGDNDEGIAVQSRALKICEASFGLLHVTTAFAQMNLGVSYHYAARLKKAGEYYRRACESISKTLGPEHRDAALCLTNLALTMPEDLRQAADLHRRAIKIFSKQGELHVDVARARINLAHVLHGTKDYAGMKSQAALALMIWNRATPDETNVAFASHLLGVAERELDHRDAAIEALERAVAIREKIGFSRRYLAESQFSLALALGRGHRARTLAKSAEMIYRRLELTESANEVAAWLAHPHK